MPPRGRRRAERERFAGEAPPQPRQAAHRAAAHEQLWVLGLPCTVFQDPTQALFIEQGRHLLPFLGCPSNTVDRYDVRLLNPDEVEACDRASAAGGGQQQQQWVEGGQEGAELEAERYRDLDYSREWQLANPLGTAGGPPGGPQSSQEESSDEGGLRGGERGRRANHAHVRAYARMQLAGATWMLTSQAKLTPCAAPKAHRLLAGPPPPGAPLLGTA